MYYVSLEFGGHDWQKQNLVTVTNGRRQSYDLYKCSGCGIMGKSYQLGHITLKATYSRANINVCRGRKNEAPPETVQVTFCNAYGKEFKNLTPGSQHKVIEPPKGYSNDVTGVWVMGVTEPVKLLATEYEAVK